MILLHVRSHAFLRRSRCCLLVWIIPNLNLSGKSYIPFSERPIGSSRDCRVFRDDGGLCTLGCTWIFSASPAGLVVEYYIELLYNKLLHYLELKYDSSRPMVLIGLERLDKFDTTPKLTRIFCRRPSHNIETSWNE